MRNIHKYIVRYATYVLSGAPEDVLTAMHEIKVAQQFNTGFQDTALCRRIIMDWFNDLELCTHYNYTTGEYISSEREAMIEAEQGCSIYPMPPEMVRTAILGEAVGYVSIH